jgi:glycosyltransferase involved in cell wall biosynthesis
MVTRGRRILVLTFYYPPDLAAGSFRAHALVEALLQQSSDVRIDVITALPNRYSTFQLDAPEEETSERLTIRRIPIPSHRSGMYDQARAFATFARGAAAVARVARYDMVFATSSRLMTATLGAWVARRQRAPLYLDLRDIFVDTIKDVLPRGSLLFRPIFSMQERWTMRRAAHVNLVSPGFGPYFSRRYPTRSFSFYTNGVDPEFVRPDVDRRQEADARMPPFKVVYAGNLGEGQGLHTIIPAVAKRLGDRASFTVIGDGGRRERLQKALTDLDVRNVELVSPMSRERLIERYEGADILFLHLNHHSAFEKVLPSKIFEYAALGKPIWAGVAGYAARFLSEEVENSAVFRPCDVGEALLAFERLTVRDVPREAFVRKYSRTRIMSDMAADLLARIGSGSSK